MFKGFWRVGLCVLAAAALFGCAEDDVLINKAG